MIVVISERFAVKIFFAVNGKTCDGVMRNTWKHDSYENLLSPWFFFCHTFESWWMNLNGGEEKSTWWAWSYHNNIISLETLKEKCVVINRFEISSSFRLFYRTVKNGRHFELSNAHYRWLNFIKKKHLFLDCCYVEIRS